MLSSSAKIIPILSVFAAAMSPQTFSNAVVLICGTILTSGPHMVSSALRAVGLGDDSRFCTSYRFFNRARWSAMVMGWLLLKLIIRTFPGLRIVIAVDETLVRRRGKKIVWKSYFRDAVRSTAGHVVTTMGIRWLCFCVLVEVPWSSRPWALPFMTVPILSEKRCAQLRKRYHSPLEWTAFIMGRIRRWFPDREIRLTADGGFASIELVSRMQKIDKPVPMVCRGRIDMVLHAHAPVKKPKGQRGFIAKKGARQPKLKDRLVDPTTEWTRIVMSCYGGLKETVDVFSGVSLWYTPGQDPVMLRWLLVKPLSKGEPGYGSDLKPAVYISSDPDLSTEEILALAVGRWNIEVTFEEMRAHMGLETQRDWSIKSIGRKAPCLFGTFSLVVIIAKQLNLELHCEQASPWYKKREPTFSDVLAAVRLHLLGKLEVVKSYSGDDYYLIPAHMFEPMRQTVAYAR